MIRPIVDRDGETRCGAPRMKGAALVSETLAQYSAMMVIEKTYGPEMTRRFYKYELDWYLRGRRSSEREVPLVDAMDQNFSRANECRGA
jgi:hypothetical protein